MSWWVQDGVLLLYYLAASNVWTKWLWGRSCPQLPVSKYRCPMRSNLGIIPPKQRVLLLVGGGINFFPLLYLWQQNLVPPPTSLPRPLTTNVCRLRYHLPSLNSIFLVIYVTTLIHILDCTEGLQIRTLQFTWNMDREAWWTCVSSPPRWTRYIICLVHAPNSAHMEQSLCGVNMACFDRILARWLLEGDSADHGL